MRQVSSRNLVGSVGVFQTETNKREDSETNNNYGLFSFLSPLVVVGAGVYWFYLAEYTMYWASKTSLFDIFKGKQTLCHLRE